MTPCDLVCAVPGSAVFVVMLGLATAARPEEHRESPGIQNDLRSGVADHGMGHRNRVLAARN